MCGRVACSADASSVQRATGATRTVGTYRISYNLSPGQNAPVVYSGRDGVRTLHAMKWGLVRVPFKCSHSSTSPQHLFSHSNQKIIRTMAGNRISTREQVIRRPRPQNGKCPQRDCARIARISATASTPPMRLGGWRILRMVCQWHQETTVFC